MQKQNSFLEVFIFFLHIEKKKKKKCKIQHSFLRVFYFFYFIKKNKKNKKPKNAKNERLTLSHEIISQSNFSIMSFERGNKSWPRHNQPIRLLLMT